MSGLALVSATDAHFAWLLGEAPPPDELVVPPGGVDKPWVFKWLRSTLPKLGGRGSWLMAASGEVVGLCSYKGSPNAERGVEIGYGVAPERRRLGYATRAIALLIEASRADERVASVLTAETALANLPSQRVLIANGFEDVGRGMDEEEGKTIVWRLALGAQAPYPVGLPS